MEVRKMKATTLNKKICLVRKVLAQLQNLLLMVEKRSSQYEENWKTIDIIQKTLEDFKTTLKVKEAKMNKSIERIWAGIEETAMCLKTLEEATDDNKENVNDVQLPSYERFDEIIKDYHWRKSKKWRKLRNKLQFWDEMEELNVLEEDRIRREKQWEVLTFTLDSDDDVTRPNRDPFEDVPAKRKRTQGDPSQEDVPIFIDLVTEQPTMTKKQVKPERADISADMPSDNEDNEYRDDENFAKYLECQAKRLKSKKTKTHKLKMILRKPIPPPALLDSPPPKCSNPIAQDPLLIMAQPMSPTPLPVLQELSLNNTEDLFSCSRPAESPESPQINVSVPESIEILRPTITNPKEYIGPVCNTFEEMDLAESLISGINLWGVSNPTSIQRVGIPALLEGHDMIVEIPSSDGKTTLASIAILNKIKPNIRQPQAVFLLPTEELAELTMRAFSDLSTLMDVTCVCCEKPEQVERSHVFLSTPAKAYDFILSRRFSIDFVNILVIDAADEMASESQSFIIKVLYSLGGDTQVIILSRRLTQEISCLSQKLRNPIYLNCSNQHDFMMYASSSSSSSPLVQMTESNGIGIENEVPKQATITTTTITNINNNNNIDFEHMNQFYVIVETDELKIRVLTALAETMETEQGIIFCNTSQKADWLARKMRENEKGLEVCSVHGGRQNSAHLMNLFQAGVSRVLITTDYITRSNLKVKPVPLVLNYEFPDSPENYTQRITCVGRTRKGAAVNETKPNPVFISFVKHENLPLLENLATKFKFSVTPMSTNNSS